MPINASVRSSFGAQGKFTLRDNFWWGTNSPVFYLDPAQYTANASTWTDSKSGIVFAKVGDTQTAKDGAHKVFMPSGNRFGFSAPHISALDVGTGNFSVDFWLYMPTTGFGPTGATVFRDGATQNAGWRTIINNGQFWSEFEFNIYINSPGTDLGFATTSTNDLETALSTIGTGWKHITAVRNASGKKMYINGSLVNSNSTVNPIGPPNTWGFNINSFWDTPNGVPNSGYGDTRFQFGRIRAYANELGSSTVLAIYNAERSLYGL